MLNEFEGLSSLTDSDIENLKKPILKGMARLKIGKTVQDRNKTIAKATSKLSSGDVFWMEALVSGLTEEGIESGPAHALSLLAAASVQEEPVTKALRDVNASQGSEETNKTIMGILEAAPELKKRTLSMHINTDEIFLRVAFVYLFRRDRKNVFQLFSADSAARAFEKVWKGGIQSFSSWSLNRYDAVDIPEDANGYVAILGRKNMKSGYYLFPTTQEQRDQLERIREIPRQMMPDATEDQELNAALAAGFQGSYLRGDASTFIGIISAIREVIGHDYLVVYAQDDDEGTLTSIHKIPASSIDEARRILNEMPEVTTHDHLRRFSEFLAQQYDVEEMDKEDAPQGDGASELPVEFKMIQTIATILNSDL